MEYDLLDNVKLGDKVILFGGKTNGYIVDKVQRATRRQSNIVWW